MTLQVQTELIFPTTFEATPGTKKPAKAGFSLLLTPALNGQSSSEAAATF